MAFKCPDCFKRVGKETLSPLSVEVKVCLECKKVIGCGEVLEFLRKIGVQKKVIDMVRNDLVCSQL